MNAATGNLTIRPAEEADLPAILGIYNWAVNQTFATLDPEPLEAEEALDWWVSHARRSVLLVAENEEGVIGWGRLLPWGRRGMSGTVEGFVYVDPLHHRKGIGRAIIDQLATEAGGLGYRTMVVQVAVDNAAGRKVHEAAGFREVGTIHDAAHKFNRWMDITLMERPLAR